MKFVEQTVSFTFFGDILLVLSQVKEKNFLKRIILINDDSLRRIHMGNQMVSTNEIMELIQDLSIQLNLLERKMDFALEEEKKNIFKVQKEQVAEINVNQLAKEQEKSNKQSSMNPIKTTFTIKPDYSF